MHGRGVEHLLHPVHVRCEAGHDDPLLRGREHVVKDRRDVPLGGDDPRHLGVGRIRHQQVDALAAEPGEPGQVGQPAVKRQLVHLEVAGMQHQAGLGADRYRERVWNGVVNCEKFEVKWPERTVAALFDLHRLRRQVVLGQLGPHQRERQPRPH